MDPPGLQPSHTDGICPQAEENKNTSLAPIKFDLVQTSFKKCSYKEQNQKDGEWPTEPVPEFSWS